MSLYVLDTDTLTLFQMGHAQVVSRVTARPIGEVTASVITVEEQLGGWYTKLRRAKKRQDLARVYQRLADTTQSLARFPILSFIEPAILRFEDLKSQKLGIAKKDLRIAAVALEANATVVTRNLRDFTRVPGLKVEDWSS